MNRIFLLSRLLFCVSIMLKCVFGMVSLAPNRRWEYFNCITSNQFCRDLVEKTTTFVVCCLWFWKFHSNYVQARKVVFWRVCIEKYFLLNFVLTKMDQIHKFVNTLETSHKFMKSETMICIRKILNKEKWEHCPHKLFMRPR